MVVVQIGSGTDRRRDDSELLVLQQRKIYEPPLLISWSWVDRISGSEVSEWEYEYVLWASPSTPKDLVN